LPVALSYATDVATALREIHYDGHAHGWVNTAAIAVHAGRAVLKGGASRQVSPRIDILGFGNLLYEMINGRKTGPDVPLPVVPRTVARTGLDGIKMAANHLASRCISDDSIENQKVATEIRLLKVLAQQLPNPRQQASAATVPLPAVQNKQAIDEEPVPSVSKGGESLPGESASDAVSCPRCGSAYVYVSKPRTGFERWLGRTGSPVQRCHRCYHRYYLLFGVHFRKAAPVENIKTRA